ncbi:hypothetical protein [Bosea sp. 124]|uniref:hypothetical protein n=1 Tax=Bosea sp. 124 TaxID=2135642 RepID=UPI0011B21F9F|nr:hypothetical protein [Bosea sp. 124]
MSSRIKRHRFAAIMERANAKRRREKDHKEAQNGQEFAAVSQNDNVPGVIVLQRRIVVHDEK